MVHCSLPAGQSERRLRCSPVERVGRDPLLIDDALGDRAQRTVGATAVSMPTRQARVATFLTWEDLDVLHSNT